MFRRGDCWSNETDGDLPPAWIRIVLSLSCFVGVLASYESVSGVGPGSALLAVMAALKLLETKQRRDQFVLLFISIFLIMSSLLREQYLWSLPYLMVGVLFTMTAWLRMSDVKKVSLGQSLQHGRPPHCLRNTVDGRHVGFLSANRDTVLGRAHRYQQRLIGTE